jgi:flagellar basal body-associated protein FliL
MATEQSTTKKTPEEADESKPAAQAGGAKASWRRYLTGKLIAAIVGGSLVIHGLGFAYYRVWNKPVAQPAAAEISLGEFHFAGTSSESGRAARADFSLHVTLLDRMDKAGREALASRRYRVQQDIEQLLRQAHARDFDDATLSELKRQLREQINESLGTRVISDVIVTDLKLQHDQTGPQTLLSASEAIEEK